MNIEKLPASRVMSRILVAIKPEESPLMAWELMRRAEVHHLPVVDQGRFVGLLTREDLLASWYGGPDLQSRRTVRALLGRRRTPCTSPDEVLGEVAARMLGAGCDALPVLAGGGRLVGLITTTDVLAAVAGRLPEESGAGEVLTRMFHLEPVLPGQS
ncbi:CBS domain-containing protein [Nonomuraea soli]|uniref:CBS domain-containing protein n=1 Tax=Nonomuraea soli TaxID=1032476 RepID=A0A7W0HNP9_9ACTN|nr:CBS domain-containing protein [Nonomuraea soli]MBA2890035.1 CBS domain-containing protein [Nonomuraea soli]